MLWQVMLPVRDFELWMKGSLWLANPNSGYELLNMRHYDALSSVICVHLVARSGRLQISMALTRR